MRQTLLLLILLVASATLLLAHGDKAWSVPAEARKMKNPVAATPVALEAARTIYAEKCARCHGDTGKGDGPEAEMYDVRPADFSDAHMMHEMTDGEIFWKMSEGRRPMPAFKKQLSEEQRWQLVHYLRAFPAKAKPAAKKPTVPTKKNQF